MKFRYSLIPIDPQIDEKTRNFLCEILLSTSFWSKYDVFHQFEGQL